MSDEQKIIVTAQDAQKNLPIFKWLYREAGCREVKQMWRGKYESD